MPSFAHAQRALEEINWPKEFFKLGSDASRREGGHGGAGGRHGGRAVGKSCARADRYDDGRTSQAGGFIIGLARQAALANVISEHVLSQVRQGV